jgi:hypothetical protein
MPKVELRCPNCSKIGNIEVSKELVENVKKGLIAVNVAKDTLCDHSFIAYVDKNLIVRNYFTPDFEVDVTLKTPVPRKKEKRIPNKEEMDLELIKINLPIPLLTYIFRVMLLKKKMTVVSDISHLSSHFIRFFDYITENSFKIGIEFIDPSKFDKNEEKYENDVIFRKVENGTVINYKFRFMVPDLEEPRILNEIKKWVLRFKEDHELTSSVILLKNELSMFYDICRYVIQQYNKDKSQLSSLKRFRKLLNSNYEKEYTDNYILLIANTLKNYFSIDIND